MTIIQIEPIEGTQFHPLQSQSHREICWEHGFIAVPERLLERAYAAQGHCELKIEDGVLTDLVPLAIPKQSRKEPSEAEDRDSMLVDLLYRITLLELGVA